MTCFSLVLSFVRFAWVLLFVGRILSEVADV